MTEERKTVQDLSSNRKVHETGAVLELHAELRSWDGTRTRVLHKTYNLLPWSFLHVERIMTRLEEMVQRVKIEYGTTPGINVDDEPGE